MAADDSLPIHSVVGRDVNLDSQLGVLKRAHELVLDMTSIWTLHRLGLLALAVEHLPIRVPWHLIDELRAEVAMKIALGEPSAHMTVFDGKPVVIDAVPGEWAARLAELTAIADLLEEKASPIDGRALASWRPEFRQFAQDRICGPSCARAAAYAASQRATLVIDDCVAADLLRSEQSFQSVSSAAVVAYLHLLGHLDLPGFESALAKLIGWNHVALPFAAPVIDRALELAEWTPAKYPAVQALRVFNNRSIPFTTLGALFVHTLVRIWRKAPGTSHEAIVDALLSRLAERPDGRAIAAGCTQVFDRAFGLDVEGARQAAHMVGAWLQRPDTPGRFGLLIP